MSSGSPENRGDENDEGVHRLESPILDCSWVEALAITRAPTRDDPVGRGDIVCEIAALTLIRGTDGPRDESPEGGPQRVRLGRHA